MEKVSAAVKTALAYAYATGRLPKGLHIETWSAAHKLCDTREALNYKVEGEALALIAKHPLKLSHDFVTRRGYRPESYQRSTSHYVTYRNGDGHEAASYRSGDASFRTPLYTEGGTFIRNRLESFTAEQIKEAMKE
ncbi:hypothetical protein [Rhizobium phage RHph_X2_26]|nr:hypothetical protein [Rhizobium phage RHph_X2_26]